MGEQGREIEGRFKSLKADLKDAKGTLAKLAQEVNATKRDIDAAQMELDRTVGAGGGGADGIIDNDEWEAQKKLREKKKAYRDKFDHHTQQRRIIDEIETKIKQTKVDLVEAFESWWQQNYGTTQRDGDAGGVLDDLQDIGGQFDSMELERSADCSFRGGGLPVPRRKEQLPASKARLDPCRSDLTALRLNPSCKSVRHLKM